MFFETLIQHPKIECINVILFLHIYNSIFLFKRYVNIVLPKQKELGVDFLNIYMPNFFHNRWKWKANNA